MSENKKHPNAEWIIAFAEGKQLQYFNTYDGTSAEWTDFKGKDDEHPDAGPWADDGSRIQWRIKPEQQWVRVAGFKSGFHVWTQLAENAEEESIYQDAIDFSHWLSDRLYYTPKECP